jgi:uncharacterized protein YoaH (UPF0181 family)
MIQKPNRTLAAALAAVVLVATLGAVALPAGAQTTTAAAPVASGVSDGDRIDRVVDRLQARYGLTDEQAAELEATVEVGVADGDSRREVARAVAERLVEFGVDPAELRRDAVRFRLAVFAERFDLADGQVRTVVETVRELRADGATRGEVRAAVKAQLDAWDALPPTPDRLDRIGERLGLTDGQVEELARQVYELRADGATRGEVRAAVKAQLDAWGVLDDRRPAVGGGR